MTALLGRRPLDMNGDKRARIPSVAALRFSAPSSRCSASPRATSQAASIRRSPEDRSNSNATFQGDSARTASQRAQVLRPVSGDRASARCAARSCRVSNAMPSFSIETTMRKSAARDLEKPSPSPPGPAKRSITGTVMGGGSRLRLRAIRSSPLRQGKAGNSTRLNGMPPPCDAADRPDG